LKGILITFKELNESKKIKFEGKGKLWEGFALQEYYEHFYNDGEHNKLYCDSYHYETGEFKYLGEDIENISDVKCEIKIRSSGDSGMTLNKKIGDGIIDLGKSGTNGLRTREDEIYTVTIEWKGKTETFDLKSKNTN